MANSEVVLTNEELPDYNNVIKNEDPYNDNTT